MNKRKKSAAGLFSRFFVKGRTAAPKEPLTFKRAAAKAGRGLLIVFLIGFTTFCIILGAMTFYVVKADNPGPLDLDNAKLNYTTIVYANDPQTGKPQEVERLYKDGNRIWVDFDKIPVNLRNAFIATEDQRFNQHDGVDWKRTVSAFANVFLHFYNTDQGGSTITQQLVKNITNNDQKRFSRKIQEILSALATEKKYSKDEILQAYLNTIGLGNGCYGVQTAANTYFGKDVSQLDLAQCATIAGLTRSPSTYDPFTHPDTTKARSKYVLDWMLKLKMITQAQHDQAVNENLTYTKDQYLAQKKSKQSYFVDQVITDITSDLMTQKGYTKDYAQSLIFSQGLKIYTTMNPTVQAALEKVYADNKNFPPYTGTIQPQSAMIVMDYSGRVAGIVGGRGQKTGDMVLDRATQSKRQPGSTIKPVAVYGPALDLNQITWSTILSDSAVTTMKNDKGVMAPWPKDDDNNYKGNMPLVQGLAESRNTIAVRVMQMIGPQRSFNFLTGKLGFTSLVSSRLKNGKQYSDIGLWLAIGAVTDGVTLREMAGGYQIFGNGGKFYKPYTYTKVVDSNGNVVIASKTAGVQVIKPDSAFVMNKLLQQVVTRSDGTASYLKLNQIVAAKTGTTSDNKDRWFVGMTPYYVGAVWFGYDQPKDVGYGTNPALKAWQAVMQIVHQNLPQKDFPSNGDVMQLPYYISTGKIASQGGAGTDVGWYRASNVPGQIQAQAAQAPASPASSRAAGSASSAPAATNSAPLSQANSVSSPASSDKSSDASGSAETSKTVSAADSKKG